jgi:RNA polymerase-binding transcription factor DksA
MLAEKEADIHRIHMDRLVNRRDRIMARITKIDAQLRHLDRDALLHSDPVQQQRRGLLTYLSSFHHKEIDQVDSALNRMATGKYGVCLGCSASIEADWLESFPESEFCSTCHRVRERTASSA